ncbi:MAG: hypothetical protein NTV01_16375 [Bacteroidia bacterium]|nr:hypothetical protein [Bacteroidia bacterium]
MLNRLLPLSLMVFFANFVDGYSQGEIDKQPKVFYRNERSWSGSLNSNGWGINYRYNKRIDAFSSMIFDVDLASIHHPKEIKSQSPYIGGWGRSYVFGKTNEAFSLRGGAGYQKELFSKFDQGGISIRFFSGAGLSLALLKPVYYQKVTGLNTATMELYWEKSLFDPDYMQSVYDIYDRESFFTGINESTVVPGFYARAGLSFEYSSEDRLIHAIEGGIQLEGFLKKLLILATSDNHQLFLTLYVSYRFGKVIDARSQK